MINNDLSSINLKNNCKKAWISIFITILLHQQKDEKMKRTSLIMAAFVLSIGSTNAQKHLQETSPVIQQSLSLTASVNNAGLRYEFQQSPRWKFTVESGLGYQVYRMRGKYYRDYTLNYQSVNNLRKQSFFYSGPPSENKKTMVINPSVYVRANVRYILSDDLLRRHGFRLKEGPQSYFYTGLQFQYLTPTIFFKGKNYFSYDFRENYALYAQLGRRVALNKSGNIALDISGGLGMMNNYTFTRFNQTSFFRARLEFVLGSK